MLYPPLHNLYSVADCWPAMKFECLEDPAFETTMLNQELGDWKYQRFPNNPRIWVAGCGTNQAVFTALRFPKGAVLGSDLSSESLKVENGTARALGISNLELKRESINQITYQGEFDYVISTGVVMINADPQATLTKIAAALKPNLIPPATAARNLTERHSECPVQSRTSGPNWEPLVLICGRLVQRRPAAL